MLPSVGAAVLAGPLGHGAGGVVAGTGSWMKLRGADVRAFRLTHQVTELGAGRDPESCLDGEPGAEPENGPATEP